MTPDDSRPTLVPFAGAPRVVDTTSDRAVDALVSARMSRQRRRDTAPEVELRKLLHRRGLRFRVEYPLPSMPRRRADIAFTRARIAVFVDGCFWHSCPQHGTMPATRREWWEAKLEANVSRDRDTDERLRDLGWESLRVWEHEDPNEASDRIAAIVTLRR